VKITKLAVPIGAAVVALGMAAAPAGAVNNIKPFGVRETLKDIWGTTEIGYTVDNLVPSTDPVPAEINGRLYEATVTIDDIEGSVMPQVQDFNARALSGANYRVLTNASSLGGQMGQGDKTTGKLYFDVVGDIPNSVVYNDGSQDVMAWFSPPPA
jgi:hypothetical protein